MQELLSPEHFTARAAVMKALAHASRLMMVHALGSGDLCVCELRDLVGHDISTVSKHLAVLKKAGIVSDEKRGKQVYYHLRLPCVLGFFDCLDTTMKNHSAIAIPQKEN